jgi:hypothetical protein
VLRAMRVKTDLYMSTFLVKRASAAAMGFPLLDISMPNGSRESRL